jgi:phosphoglycolate phosphatase
LSSLPQYLIFDLDGTLADSAEGILYSFRLTLDELGMTPSDEELRALIGPPIQDSFGRLGFEGEARDEIVDRYRGHYGRFGVQRAHLYEGIEVTLDRLQVAGVRMGVATAKRVDFAQEMLAQLDVAAYFEIIAGVSLDDSLITKKQVMNEVLEFFGPQDPRRVWMVGDREQDVLASIFHGVVPIGVLWGYGSRDELELSGAEFVIESPEQLFEIVVEV